MGQAATAPVAGAEIVGYAVQIADGVTAWLHDAAGHHGVVFTPGASRRLCQCHTGTGARQAVTAKPRHGNRVPASADAAGNLGRGRRAGTWRPDLARRIAGADVGAGQAPRRGLAIQHRRVTTRLIGDWRNRHHRVIVGQFERRLTIPCTDLQIATKGYNACKPWRPSRRGITTPSSRPRFPEDRRPPTLPSRRDTSTRACSPAPPGAARGCESPSARRSNPMPRWYA